MFDSGKDFYEHQKKQEIYFTDREWQLNGEEPPNYKGGSSSFFDLFILLVVIAFGCIFLYGIYTFIMLVATYCS